MTGFFKHKFVGTSFCFGKMSFLYSRAIPRSFLEVCTSGCPFNFFNSKVTVSATYKTQQVKSSRKKKVHLARTMRVVNLHAFCTNYVPITYLSYGIVPWMAIHSDTSCFRFRVRYGTSDLKSRTIGVPLPQTFASVISGQANFSRLTMGALGTSTADKETSALLSTVY